MLKKLSIGAKNAYFTGAVIFLVTAGLSAFAYHYSSTIFIKQMEDMLITHATHAARRIESTLKTELTVLDAVSGLAGLQSMGSLVQRRTLDTQLRICPVLSLAVVDQTVPLIMPMVLKLSLVLGFCPECPGWESGCIGYDFQP